MQLGIFRFAAFHEPAEHVLIFTFEQPDIAGAIILVEVPIILFHKRHQQHIKLKHAAAAVPEESIEFSCVGHHSASRDEARIITTAASPGTR
ncbi:hypothetical protein D1872_318440 [compost metagenome]